MHVCILRLNEIWIDSIHACWNVSFPYWNCVKRLFISTQSLSIEQTRWHSSSVCIFMFIHRLSNQSLPEHKVRTGALSPWKETAEEEAGSRTHASHTFGNQTVCHFLHEWQEQCQKYGSHEFQWKVLLHSNHWIHSLKLFCFQAEAKEPIY